jgi:hypothetical protein
MNKLPDEQANEEKLLQILAVLDPGLYRIKTYLEEYKVNPDIVCRVIRALGNVNIGTGYGEVSILIKSKTVTQIRGGESDVINLPIDA